MSKHDPSDKSKQSPFKGSSPYGRDVVTGKRKDEGETVSVNTPCVEDRLKMLEERMTAVEQKVSSVMPTKTPPPANDPGFMETSKAATPQATRSQAAAPAVLAEPIEEDEDK